MYESFFLLSHRPFAAAPHAEMYIPTGSLEQARQTLVRCLERAEGPGLVIGPSGTGKSLLCQLLAKHFRGRFWVATLSSVRLCTRRALLQNILFELRLPYRDMDEGELRLSLIDHLEPRSGGPEGLVLIVDEAHTLPLRLLEEIRLLTNLVCDGQSRVRLILAGGMALEERLASPKLESFQQRIAARCYLQPFRRDETILYLQEQVRRCGGLADSLLTAEAQAAVHTATDGIPRLINQLCDHALMLAALGGLRQIDAAGIEEAWADLQQLPIPLHEPPVLPGASRGNAGGVIEFGQLADEPAVVAGTVGPGVEQTAVAALEEISQQIDHLQADKGATTDGSGMAADDFSPASTGGTEIELIFHGAHDPFGGHWEEEEVVIDRYASLEGATLRNTFHATSAEAQSIGAAVTASLDSMEQASSLLEDFGRLEACPTNDPPATLPAAADFQPASDPLLPEESPVIGPVRRTTISLRDLGRDDRDMIVIEDEPRAPTIPQTNRPRRQEYRQLFSSLRNK